MTTKTSSYLLRLPPAVKARAEEYSASLGVSLNGFFCLCIDAYLNGMGAPPAPRPAPASPPAARPAPAAPAAAPADRPAPASPPAARPAPAAPAAAPAAQLNRQQRRAKKRR